MERISITLSKEQIKRALAILSQGKYSEVADLIALFVSALKKETEHGTGN